MVKHTQTIHRLLPTINRLLGLALKGLIFSFADPTCRPLTANVASLAERDSKAIWNGKKHVSLNIMKYSVKELILFLSKSISFSLSEINQFPGIIYFARNSFQKFYTETKRKSE